MNLEERLRNSGREDDQQQSLAGAEDFLRALANLSIPIEAAGGEFFLSFFEKLPVTRAVERPDVEARYKTLVEQIPAVIFMAFLDEGVSEAYVSPHIEKVLGFTQEEWLNDPVLWYQRIHPDDKSRWNVEAAGLVVSGQPLRAVYRVLARDGHVVWFHCEVKMVLTADGRPWFIHGAAFDVSELKRAEEALRQAHDELEARVRQRTAELEKVNSELEREIAERKRMQLQLARKAQELTRSNTDLEQFAYSASHDLQEPLRNISIYSDWLRRRYHGKLDADADQFIDFLSEGAQRMIVMLRQLLAYADAARASEEPQDEVDANAVLARALEDLQALIHDNRATITHGPLPRLRIREVHLQQVFQNLISNAIKYRSDLPPSVYISVENANPYWLFSVKDSGIGIDPKYHDKVFGLFQRLHGREKYSGSGIGLALCKRIVERYGGKIWVESEVDRGSTFFFTIPRESEEPRKSA
jgi:PAS domain S-box-containing protein